MASRPLARVGQAAWLLTAVPRELRVPYASDAALARRQQRNVASAVTYAYEHVPFYRDSMRSMGLRPGDVRGAPDLARLPLVDRATVQADPERFRSRELSRDRHWQTRSGGTTAAPLTVLNDPRGLLHRKAHYARSASLQLGIAGRRVGARTLLVGAPEIPAPATAGAIRAVRGLVVQRRVTSVFAPFERTLAVLDEFRPHVLSGCGSYLAALFAHLHRSSAAHHLPGLVVWGADAMSPAARSLIREHFGIPVLSVYAAKEAPHLGFECAAHTGYHLNVDLYPCRIVRADGADAAPGHPGDLVVSNLVNRGTVLLNYRLGDRVTPGTGSCACGRRLPLLSGVLGRSSDWLLARDGSRLHAGEVLAILDDVAGILGRQVVQTVAGALDVRLVAAHGVDREAMAPRVVARLGQLRRGDLTATVRWVDGFPTTAAGKVREVIGLGG